MMSENLYILCQDDFGNYEIRHDDKIFYFLWEVAPVLNEQQDTINELNEQIEQLNFAIDDLLTHTNCDEIKKENEYLRKRIKAFSDELYCKDRKLEELGINIECCDKND